MKIRPAEAELSHADRHDEATSRFSQFLRTHLTRLGRSTQLTLAFPIFKISHVFKTRA